MAGNRVSPYLFDGHIASHVYVDNFRENSSVSFHFLSHAHTDHFPDLNNNFCGQIYCSELTRDLILLSFPQLHHSIASLEMRCARVFGRGSESFAVTLFEANHCPGSVMFLFEGGFGRVLYTGDFRFDQNVSNVNLDLANLGIDCLILDATFGHPDFDFPSRASSVSTVLALLSEKLEDSRVSKIWLENKLGDEFLIVSIFEHFQVPLYLDPNSVRGKEILTVLGQNNRCLTFDLSASKIRLVSYGFYQRDPSDLYIRSSSMWFVENNIGNQLTIPRLDQFHLTHVFSSMHSDFSEIKSLLQLIKPASISFLALPVRKSCDYSLGARAKRLKIPDLTWIVDTYSKYCDTSKQILFVHPVLKSPCPSVSMMPFSETSASVSISIPSVSIPASVCAKPSFSSSLSLKQPALSFHSDGVQLMTTSHMPSGLPHLTVASVPRVASLLPSLNHTVSAVFEDVESASFPRLKRTVSAAFEDIEPLAGGQSAFPAIKELEAFVSRQFTPTKQYPSKIRLSSFSHLNVSIYPRKLVDTGDLRVRLSAIAETNVSKEITSNTNVVLLQDCPSLRLGVALQILQEFGMLRREFQNAHLEIFSDSLVDAFYHEIFSSQSCTSREDAIRRSFVWSSEFLD